MRLVMAVCFLGVLLCGSAFAQMVAGGSSGAVVSLYSDTAGSAGNGADLTEDQLKTYTIPPNTLVNVGDMIHITAGGALGGTTDNKTVRIRMNSLAGSVVGLTTGTAVSVQRWVMDVWIVKMDTGTAHTSISGSTNGATGSAPPLTDSTPNPVLISGQNATNSVAGSVTCTFFAVSYIKAPGT